MLLQKCAICGNKKSRFIKEQEASGLWSSLGLKTPSSKIPLSDDILISMQFDSYYNNSTKWQRWSPY